MNVKWTNFVVSKSYIQSITKTLSLANTLAYYGIRTLRIHNVYIVQALEWLGQ
jgi:hypothetical protein